MNLNQFHTDPHFQVAELTAAINEAKAAPTVLGSLGIFQEQGIRGSHFEVELDGNALTLVMPSERGGVPSAPPRARRKKVPFSTAHLEVPGFIGADEVLNARAFGSQTELQTIQSAVNSELERAKQSLLATRELMRAGAITGLVVDAEGNTLLDIYSAFGLTRPDAVVFNPAAKKTKAMLAAGKRAAKEYLGPSMVKGWMLICGSDFFDAFSGADDVVAYLQNRNGNSNDNVADMTDGMNFHNVTAFSYDASVGGMSFIDPKEAYLLPRADGMLIGRNAPADYVETVGTPGLPFYARQELAPMGKGVMINSQSNPLYLNTRPLAIRRFTIA